MQISDQGLRLVKVSEGLRLVAYLCSAGVPTIGYGHTKGVQLGLTCTKEQAEAWLVEDLRDTEGGVRELVRVPLTQGQYDALVSFAFNLGTDIDEDEVAEGLGDSTLLRKLNQKDYQGAADEFLKWVKARKGGKLVVEPGLVTRRKAERDLFLGTPRT